MIILLNRKQILTVYDQYDRLLTGDENRFKQPVEYVVFEKHLINPKSPWRISGKVIPEATNIDRSTSNRDQSDMTVATAS